MQKGQVLAVVLLILGVVATIALSVASRSVTEVRVSTTQDESSRALEAAEIGLEKYLGDLPLPVPGHKVDVPDINAGYYIPSQTDIGGSNSYKVPYELVAGDVATIDLPWGQPSHSDYYSSIRVCWGTGASFAKVELEFFYVLGDALNQGRVAVRRIGFDPHSPPISGFVYTNSINQTCGTDTTFNYAKTISLTSDLPNGNLALNLGNFPGGNKSLFLRVRMLGNGTTAQPVGVQITNPVVGVNFPIQGGEVVAVGEAGETVQKVRATVQLWDLPPMFDSAMFSGTSLTK